jgi:hypothetical protein
VFRFSRERIRRGEVLEMNKGQRKKMAAEWKVIMEKHPTFARSFLAQQAIMMEASELGYRIIDKLMCKLLETKLPVLFEDYWAKKCKEVVRIEPGGVIGCLTETNRDPARCFGTDDEEGFFEDPLAGGKTLPPKPPIPPL